MSKRYLLATHLLILLWCGVIYAADLNFRISAGAGYNSNVYQTVVASAKDSYYFRLSPSATLGLPLNKGDLNSDVRAVLQQHLGQTNVNLYELIFTGLGRYNLSDHMSFSMQDRLIVSERLTTIAESTDVEEPVDTEEPTDAIRRRGFVDNSFRFGVQHGFGGGLLVTSLRYTNTIRDYRNTEQSYWVLHSGRFSISYSFGHKTSTQLYLGLTRKVYGAGVNYTSVPIVASLGRKLSSRIQANLSLGWQSRSYNEQDHNWSKPTVALDITAELIPNTTSRFTLGRKIYDSDLASGSAYASTAQNISLALSLSDAIRLTLNGIYSENSYVGMDRTYKLFYVRGAIQYRFSKWGALALGYRYSRRIYSALIGSDYYHHSIDLSYVLIF